MGIIASTAQVRPDRVSSARPCPICHSHGSATRGRGERCYGYTSDDGQWAHCTREEHAGGLEQHPNSRTYAHRLTGDCQCGVAHGEGAATPPREIGRQRTPDEIIARYDYRDETGEVLYQTMRLEPKDFRQRRPNASGGWIWNLNGVRRVLYRLPELLATDPSQTVYIVEGEKDVDRMRSLGLVATCNVGGASKWRAEYTSALRGRTVVILPDNDDAGRKHAGQVARSLAGVAASVKVVELPGLPSKGDVSDWLDAGGTAEELDRLAATARPCRATGRSAPGIMSAAELLGRTFPKPRYAVEGILTEGLGILAGRPKIGKSWLGLGLAIAVATGGKALGSVDVEAGDVLYLALEDGERRLQSRLSVLVDEPPAGLYVATEWPRLDDGGLALLDTWLVDHAKARLVMVDTLKRVRPLGRRDASLYDQDYEALQALADLAKQRGVCILVVHHTRKAGADDPLELVSGSFGLSGAVDGVLVLKRDRGQADAVLAIVDRDQGDRELALKWDPDAFLWVLLGEAEDYRRSKERAEIINLLRQTAPAPMMPKPIADALNRKGGAVRFLLHKMAGDGEVRKVDSGYTIPVPVNTANTANTANRRSGQGDLPGEDGGDGLLAPVSGVSGVDGDANSHDQEGMAPPVSGVSGVSSASKAREVGEWRR